MKPILPMVVLLVSAEIARAQCPSTTTCAFPPVQGNQPSHDEINVLMERLAANTLGDGVPALSQMEQGPSRVKGTPALPCVLFKAIGVVESEWLQFCPNTRLTVISASCGFGISQITSNAESLGPRITSDPDYNLHAGGNALISKWNADSTYGGKINDSNPLTVENWYYATWAYNGFANSNNPHNPNLPANRPPYAGPGSLSRGSYPYQELVWGRIRFPMLVNGQPAYSPVEVSYPNLGDIPPPPSGTSLFQQDLVIRPEHPNPCSDPCSNGCPDPRVVIVDNLDEGFALNGSAETALTGGWAEQFLHVPAQQAGASLVSATFTPSLPADGIWEISGWIPRDPATSANIPVVVAGIGGPTTLQMDQSQTTQDWQVLGKTKLRKDPTRVTVRDDSGDQGERVGIDAIRWRWIGNGGGVQAGETCANSTECEGVMPCICGRCALPCWENACPGDRTCDPTTGVCEGTTCESTGSSSAGGTNVITCTDGEPPVDLFPWIGFALLVVGWGWRPRR